MEINPFDDTYFMKQALLQAKEAFEKDEVPVGQLLYVTIKLLLVPIIILKR